MSAGQVLFLYDSFFTGLASKLFLSIFVSLHFHCAQSQWDQTTKFCKFTERSLLLQWNF